jgi:hypothetical protein
MSHHPRSDRTELIKHMLEALQTPQKSLSTWENQFLESISDQFDRTKSLSEKQFDRLETIYAEKTD